MKKGVKALALALAVAGLAGGSSITTASAKQWHHPSIGDGMTQTRKTYYTHSAATLESEITYKESTFHRVASAKNKKLRVYNSKYLRSYSVTTSIRAFDSKAEVTVKLPNGKMAKYRYVIGGNGTNRKYGLIDGWLFAGYLTPKSSPKKVHHVKVDKTSYAIPKVLKKSVSNTNVNGFKHLNDIRLALLKANEQVSLHPGYYNQKNSLYYAQHDLNDYVALYNDIAYHGGKHDNQAYVDDLLKDVNEIINYKSWNAKYAAF
ncbi:hypothetical protein IWT25_01418 [Secundilactobacillus pentosiphilus]|uniref:S-layer protein n=1 Tax=Secundilactobacillus pentosiphilus TaxID=1714682 RepID=A0A1Z5IWF4_9LACO|nr:hypothetical protein [Secundilactobacillus pentosiphilus]GAX06093.1 hypothetical protein IWT25_01418 [Secundilactobacillus pentosiphilus]